LPVTRLLLDRGADLSIRVKLPGHYERPGEIVECTPLSYAMLFPGAENHGHAGPSKESSAVTLLRARGAVE
jgi:hypothetical protein